MSTIRVPRGQHALQALADELSRRHGITAKEPKKKRDAYFWPDQVLKDAAQDAAAFFKSTRPWSLDDFGKSDCIMFFGQNPGSNAALLDTERGSNTVVEDSEFVPASPPAGARRRSRPGHGGCRTSGRPVPP